MPDPIRQIGMSAPDISDDEIELVVRVLRSGQLSIGHYVEQFERAFAEYVGTRSAVAVSSGTAGLHMCIRGAGIGEGDEVITTPFSFVASANCILYERATPVFVDIDPCTMNIDPARVADAVTERTKAILPVHVFGQPCEMDRLLTLARIHNLVVVEDACEALGAAYQGTKTGGFGMAGVFGFYPNKQMTTGEGGIITTNDPDFAARLRSLRNHGRGAVGTWLHHECLGYNYRLDEMSAALGCSQLRRIDSLLERRYKAAEQYGELLADVPGVIGLSAADPSVRISWFVYIVRLDEDISRDRVIEHLSQAGIPARAYFPPIHLQPYMRERFGYQEGDFPVTERVAQSTLALPFHTNITSGDIEYVVNHLRSAIGRSVIGRDGYRRATASIASHPAAKPAGEVPYPAP
jgi:dTDP-4-amino-4,6-dideoxygalactose transaminase